MPLGIVIFVYQLQEEPSVRKILPSLLQLQIRAILSLSADALVLNAWAERRR